MGWSWPNRRGGLQGWADYPLRQRRWWAVALTIEFAVLFGGLLWIVGTDDPGAWIIFGSIFLWSVGFIWSLALDRGWRFWKITWGPWLIVTLAGALTYTALSGHT